MYYVETVVINFKEDFIMNKKTLFIFLISFLLIPFVQAVKASESQYVRPKKVVVVEDAKTSGTKKSCCTKSCVKTTLECCGRTIRIAKEINDSISEVSGMTGRRASISNTVSDVFELVGKGADSIANRISVSK